MEKYSKWRDPSTGIHPFLPLVSPSSPPLILSILSAPLTVVLGVLRAAALAAILLLHILLVEGICLIFAPVPPLFRSVSAWCTALTTRLALLMLGFYWIDHEMVAPKRGSSTIVQAVRSPIGGDLIISNWTSYIDILYLAFKYNPIFILPVFDQSSVASPAMPTTGRHTGTGSANIGNQLAQPSCMGYVAVPFLRLILHTGNLPPTASPTFPTVKKACSTNRPVILFPEGTTSNNRAVLRLGKDVLKDDDVTNWQGIIWVTSLKYPAPSTWLSSSTCPTPSLWSHLRSICMTIPPRTMTVRTLHPSMSPSGPSFLPSEILRNSPGGLEGLESGAGIWKEAIATVLAECGRLRRVRGMGWVEKQGFLDYWKGTKRR